ncbi:hypothetical protein ACFQ4C_01990 [Larkinella insperata]|uniref:Uncharacterized protein n=1 Tax=Larkinella insperata TaxID=332158 RepID=A0ABW3Q123_9BACT|nr:hypothetical protein [Larkinella insperata]
MKPILAVCIGLAGPGIFALTAVLPDVVPNSHPPRADARTARYPDGQLAVHLLDDQRGALAGKEQLRPVDAAPPKKNKTPEPPTAAELPRVDFEGTPLTSSAPIQLGKSQANARLARPVNNYDFAEQKAKWTVNLNRFPPFESNSRFPFIYDGPLFLPKSSFDILSRGATHVYPLGRIRERHPSYFTAQNLPRQKRAVMIGDFTLYKIAGIQADRLAAKVGESDPRVIRLRQLNAGPKVDGVVKHRMVIHPETIDYLAWYLWDEIKGQTGQGVGVDLVSIDVETDQYPAVENASNPNVHNQRIADQYQMLGLLYRAVGKLAAAEGKPIRIMAYSDGLIEGGGKLWNKEDRAFFANYLTGPESSKPFSSSTHPYILALKELGGFVGNGNYSRCTWGHESWYDKDAAGNYIIVNGVRQTRTTDHTAQLYGQPVKLKGIDSRVNNQKEADVAMLFPTYTLSAIQSYGFALNDGQPRRRYSQKAGVFKNTEMAEYLRHDTETLGFAPGNELGDRPLNPQLIEGVTMSRSAFGALWLWSAEGPYEFGKKQEGGISAKGPIEFMLKGRHRSQNLLVPFFAKHSDYWMGFPFKNFLDEFNGDPNRANAGYAQKYPPIWTLSAGRDLLIFAQYFAQDVDENRELKVTHGKLPGWSYTLPMKGREAAFEAVVLPEAVRDCDPKDLRFEYTDLMGTRRIVSGDWHYPAN